MLPTTEADLAFLKMVNAIEANDITPPIEHRTGICRQCGTDIIDKAHNAMYCYICAALRKCESDLRAYERRQAEKKSRRKTHCIKCDKDIMERGVQAKFCEPCATISAAERSHESYWRYRQRRYSECQKCGADIRMLHANCKFCLEHQAEYKPRIEEA